jgi:hypothetical protein
LSPVEDDLQSSGLILWQMKHTSTMLEICSDLVSAGLGNLS